MLSSPADTPPEFRLTIDDLAGPAPGQPRPSNRQHCQRIVDTINELLAECSAWRRRHNGGVPPDRSP
jgi:hypothetical protein